MVFRTAHAAGLLRGRLKDRQAHLLTDRIVAPHQLLQLFLRHVQLFAGLEVDGVDDAVGVDVLAVYMGADQHLAAVEVFRQPPRGFVGLPGIDRRKGFGLGPSDAEHLAVRRAEPADDVGNRLHHLSYSLISQSYPSFSSLRASDLSPEWMMRPL